MNGDIYWTHACLNALKRYDYHSFNLYKTNIYNSERIHKLNHIKHGIEQGDANIRNILRSYVCPFIIHVT